MNIKNLGSEVPPLIKHDLKGLISFTLFVLASASIGHAEAQGGGSGSVSPPSPVVDLERVDTWGLRRGIFSSFARGISGSSNPRDASSTAQGLWEGSNTWPTAGTPNDPTSKCETLVSNPINLATANKIETEVDFQSTGGEMPLRFERTYNRNARRGESLMPGWLTNFDFALIGDIADGVGGYLFYSLRPDGTKIDFSETGLNSNRWVSGALDSNTYVIKEADGTFSLHNAETGQVETYGLELTNQLGGSTRNYKIISLKNKSGVGWTFSYAGNARDTLTAVTHTSGKSISIANVPSTGMTMVAPGGGVYSYTYAIAGESYENGSAFSITRASLPEGTVIDYHYAPFLDSNALLLGKSFNGVRYSTFTWSTEPGSVIDNDGIIFSAPWPVPVSSEHAGGVEKSTFDFEIVEIGGEVTKAVETSPRGRVTTYKFAAGKLQEAVGDASATCLGSVKSVSYDEYGYKDKETDKNGTVTDYDYDAAGRLQRRVEAVDKPETRTTTYSWDNLSSLPLAETLEGVSRTEYTYTADNRLSTLTTTNLAAVGVQNQQRVTTYAYTKHPNGVVAQMVMDGPIAGVGDAVTYSYDESGNLISFANSLNHTATYSNYNDQGLAGRFVDVNGATTEFAYDDRGRLTDINDYYAGSVSHTQYRYSLSGLLERIVYGDGRTRHYVYDDARRLISEYELTSSGDGGRIEYVRNNASDVEQVDTYSLDPAGNALALVDREFIDYDELGQVLAVRGNHGQNVRFTYDRMGNVTNVLDSSSRETINTYDALNRPVTSSRPGSGTERMEYDDADRLIKVSDARELETTYAYDGFGSLWALISPDSGTTAFTYSPSGQQLSLTRANGVSLNFEYADPLGRVTRAGSPAYGRIFEYDTCNLGKGLMCSGSTETSLGQSTRVSFTYTDHGDLESKRETGFGADLLTSYQYDPHRRVVGVGYPTGVSVAYSYEFGRLKGMSTTVGGTTTNVVSEAKYQPFGPLTGWKYGNNLEQRLTIDTDGRTTGISAGTANVVRQSLTYAYNADNMVSAVTNGIFPDRSHTYGYDPADRINSDFIGGGVHTIADQHDSATNRVFRDETDAGIAKDVTYAISPTSNRVTSQSGNAANSFVYNAQGNRISASGWQGSRSYTYDDFDRLVSVNVNGVVSSYTVNAFDQRVRKSVRDRKHLGSLDTKYVFTEQNTLMAHSTAAGAWRSYLWFGDQLVGIVRPDNVLLYVHSDNLNRPEIVTNSLGDTVWNSTNLSYHSVASSPGVVLVGFPGQIWDEDTSTWYNGYRDYDPHLGRYLQTDPIGIASGLNTYAYVGGNPVSYVDPDGLQFMPYSRNLNTRGSSGERLPDGVAQRMNVVWGIGTVGAAASVYTPAAVGLGIMSPEISAATANVCKTPAGREALFAACVAIGACQGTRPSMSRINQQENLLKISEAVRRTSKRFDSRATQP